MLLKEAVSTIRNLKESQEKKHQEATFKQLKNLCSVNKYSHGAAVAAKWTKDLTNTPLVKCDMRGSENTLRRAKTKSATTEWAVTMHSWVKLEWENKIKLSPLGQLFGKDNADDPDWAGFCVGLC